MISVVMSTYNGEKYLNIQLDSILFNQSLSIDEIIIVDDCSTDMTFAILSQYSRNNSRVKLLQNDTNVGVVKSFEKALLNCNGDYILFSDQDDIWHSDKVEKLVNSIGNNLLLHSDARLINTDGKVIQKSFSLFKDLQLKKFTDFLIGNIVTGCTMVCTRELLELILPFPDNIVMHDHYLAIHASFNSRLGYYGEALTDYRQHDKNVMGGFGIAYEQLRGHHQKQVLQLSSILAANLFPNHYNDIKMAINYHNSIANSKFPSFSTLSWVFKMWGGKRVLGLLLRGAFGELVTRAFFDLKLGRKCIR